ncbi:hypothetical protein [Nonomuraea rubra]|uniref:hypothetical protein n=1 Tax=Nonomuraea rubra TaxID=46180 RepID=UPI0031EB540D
METRWWTAAAPDPADGLAVGRPDRVFSRYQRNMMLDVLGADFVRTARAKGVY